MVSATPGRRAVLLDRAAAARGRGCPTRRSGRAVDAEPVGVRAHPRQRGLRALLHHVADLAGELAPRPCRASCRVSMNMMSPPTGVQPRPVATPTYGRALGHLGVRSAAARGCSAMSSSSIVTALGARSPAASSTAALAAQRRRSRARGCARRPRACSCWMISLERLVVELELLALDAVLGRAAWAGGGAARSRASRARCSPGCSITSMRSSSGWGSSRAGWRWQMNITFDRSTGTSR